MYRPMLSIFAVSGYINIHKMQLIRSDSPVNDKYIIVALILHKKIVEEKHLGNFKW